MTRDDFNLFSVGGKVYVSTSVGCHILDKAFVEEVYQYGMTEGSMKFRVCLSVANISYINKRMTLSEALTNEVSNEELLKSLYKDLNGSSKTK